MSSSYPESPLPSPGYGMSTSNPTSNKKLPLPAFLKMLTDANMTMPRAMGVAAKIYKTHNTPALLAQFTEPQLKALGVDAKEDRKAVLVAIRGAGYTNQAQAGSPGGGTASTSGSRVAGSSKSKSLPNANGIETKRPAKKRKRLGSKDASVNDLLPTVSPDSAASYGNFDFEELLDEAALKTKSIVVNRAPVMTAWATVVAERMGFRREEALSIASAYTEMNAISKGVSLGIFDAKKGKGIELAKGESQPYVDIMGRRPVFSSRSSQWRALIKGEPIDPVTAFSYLTRSFRQTLPHIIGALRLLANSYSVKELNQRGFGLYAEFRPEVDGWGKRGEVRCGRILELRGVGKVEGVGEGDEEGGEKGEGLVQNGSIEQTDGLPEPDATNTNGEEPSPKKSKPMTLEEYEASPDDSLFFDNL